MRYSYVRATALNLGGTPPSRFPRLHARASYHGVRRRPPARSFYSRSQYLLDTVDIIPLISRDELNDIE